jgi:hypothetical protein
MINIITNWGVIINYPPRSLAPGRSPPRACYPCILYPAAICVSRRAPTLAPIASCLSSRGRVSIRMARFCPTRQHEGSWTSKSSTPVTNLAYPRPNRASGERSRPGLDGRHGHGRRREGTGEIRVEDSVGSSPRSHYQSSCCRFGFPMPPNPGRQAMVPVNRWRRRGVQGTGGGRRTAASSMRADLWRWGCA